MPSLAGCDAKDASGESIKMTWRSIWVRRVHLLKALGRDPDGARELFDESRGWAAGIAFDLRPGPDVLCPAHLSCYLDHEVLRRLPPDESQFLLKTSALEVVTLDGAVALAGSTAPGLLARVVRRALPFTPVEPNGFVLQPWFRRFLVSETQTSLAGEVVELGRRHARFLE